MVFEGLDGALSPVAAMKASWGELIFDSLSSHEVMEELRSFIVKTMELGTKTTTLKEAENGFIGLFDGGLLSIWDWFGMDGVAVVVVEKEDVVVAADGWDNKATCLIGANLAGYGVAVGVDLMSAGSGSFLETWW